MKKILPLLIIVYALIVSVNGASSQSCEACLSGHSDESVKCHNQTITRAEVPSCHSEKAIDTCDMNDTTPSDCQICAHSDVPTAKIESVTAMTMEKQFLGQPSAQESFFSNQIPPPTFIIRQNTSPPSILANHLTFLEPIRLLI